MSKDDLAGHEFFAQARTKAIEAETPRDRFFYQLYAHLLYAILQRGVEAASEPDYIASDFVMAAAEAAGTAVIAAASSAARGGCAGFVVEALITLMSDAAREYAATIDAEVVGDRQQ